MTLWSGRYQRFVVKNKSLNHHYESDYLYLEFFVVVRQGLVEVDETISTTLVKEFSQEALCSENATEEERQLMSERLEQLFANGIPVSKTTENPV